MTFKPVLSYLGETKLELGPSGEPAGANWTLARDEEDVAWLVFDRPGASANTISEQVLRELSNILDRLEDDLPKALVLRSGKLSGFAAGADIGDFRGVTDAAALETRLTEGHGVLDRLEKLKCPTIAVVHGFALGGGFELALACDHRIAVSGAQFAFPEVRLGLHPGLGGTFRLTELIDPLEAMTMMLTGKTAHTRKAKSLGIAETVTEERHVRNAVRALADGDRGKRSRGLKARAFELGALRGFAAKRMRAQAGKKAPKEHYPAPYALIDIWEKHGGDRKAMQKAEIRSFAQLLVSETARNLIGVFFKREKLKAMGDGVHGIGHVHVIGAGTMGADIAAEIAIRGFSVSLGDIALPALAHAMKSAAKRCGEAHLGGIETRDAFDRLMPDPAGHGLARADLVIEAVPEKPALKEKIFAMIEAKAPAHAIVATNTSSLDIDALAATLKRPERFGGLHFFNPVAKLELVEVVRHAGTDDETAAKLRAFTGAIGHLPAPVRNWPGFLVNRALTPYLLEAALMVDERMTPETVDKAAERFGMPMGPLEVADQVGLDICLHVADSLRNRLAKPIPDVPAWMRKRVEKGDLGAKTGRGTYAWENGKPKKQDVSGEITEEMIDRLILPLLNACVECLREGVIEDEELLDGAMIFATGFAPFRGGPMHYARTRGTREIAARLQALAAKFGPRFEPDEGWNALG
ncbi:MAG: 3-hydroxyacyl-CoA dehydrogenase NAD-binding domain-containing protein [Flavobacteriaceae bacterium]